jgi:hypothetical protein
MPHLGTDTATAALKLGCTHSSKHQENVKNGKWEVQKGNTYAVLLGPIEIQNLTKAGWYKIDKQRVG